MVRMISCPTGSASAAACCCGYAGFQPADRVHVPAGRISQLVRCKAHRHPELNAVQLPGHKGKFKLARHHADNFVGLAIEKYLLSQDVRIAIEPGAPHLVADDGQLLAAIVFLRSEGAPHQGRHAENGKDIGSESCCTDARRRAQSRQFVTGVLVASNAGECVGIAVIRTHAGSRRAPQIVTDFHPLNFIAHHHQPAWIPKGQRPQQNPFDNGENGGGRPNAEGQREDRRKREAGRAAQLP